MSLGFLLSLQARARRGGVAFRTEAQLGSKLEILDRPAPYWVYSLSASQLQ